MAPAATQTIPMNASPSIPWSRPQFWGREKQFVNAAMESMWLSGGDFLDRFQAAWQDLFEKKHALLTSNGTTSLHLIYLGLGLGPGDEVIVPGFGFLAAANIAVQMGLVPVFADVDPDTWCLRAEDIAVRISGKTKAIVAIHTYGNVCDMNAIMGLARSHAVPVIEDCAEALFSRLQNRYCGTFADAASFSFQATKTITTGEGGLIVTDDDSLYRTMRLFHSHGLSQRGTYAHEIPGHNFRLTNLQAALGLGQLEQMTAIVRERQRVFGRYRRFFQDQPGIHLQQITAHADPLWWAFAVKLEPKAFSQGRDAVIAALRTRGIETRPGFVSSSRIAYFAAHEVPVSEHLGQSIISLPSFAGLTDAQIDMICDALMETKF